MDSLSFLRTGSTSPDYRSSYLPRKYDGNISGTRMSFSQMSQSGQREYSSSPLRRTVSPSFTRYRADRNLSFDRSSSNIYDSLSTSRSRNRSRRLSLAGSYSPTSYTADTSFSRGRDYSQLSPSSYNRHSYIYERKTPTDFLEKRNSRPTYTSNLSSPTYSSRINITPTHLNLGSIYGRSYSSSDAYNSSESAYLKDLKKSSYVSGYLPSYSVNPLRRDTSMPTYSRYSSSPGYYSSLTSQPRSKSMSRFSYQTLTSSDSIDRDEPFSSKFFKVLNRYSNDIYENKSFRDSMDYSSYKKSEDLDHRKIGDYSKASSRYKRYDQPKKTARELFNALYDDLTDDTREKDWLGRAKNEYGKHQRRLSTLLMSYNDVSANNLTVPDTLEATFTSTSRRSTPRGSIATPVIKIEKEDADESNDYDNSAVVNLENLLDEQESKDLSNKDLTRLLKTDNPEEVAKLLLDHGESFRPDEISTAILPSGEKALVMTQTKQTAVGEDGIRRKSISPGLTSSSQSNLLSPSYYEQNSLLPDQNQDQDQEWANEEIEKFTQLTGEFEESLQTLEHFIARNRCLFPENIIIYQKIVYHKSSAGEIVKQGLPSTRRFSFADDKDVCAVKVREKLVLPHGCRKNGYDVLEMLRRCYPRFEEVEVVYDDEENIKETLLKQENGQLDPFDDDFDQPVTRQAKSKASNYEIDVDSGRYSPALSDEDELLQRCRRGDEGLPYFVTRPKSQTTMPGQPVRFTCSVAGNPEPEVVWYKDGLPLPKDGRFAAMNNFGICSLRICPTRADDKGLYTVEIENSVGSASADLELDVLSTGQHRLARNLAFTRIPPYYVHMSEGDPLTLRCVLQGEVKPKVTWYKGSKEIRADDKYRLVAESDWQYMLQIRDLDRSDTALYTVRADDGISSVKHSVEVNVAPKRDIDDTITEYEIVKKMGPIKMAPVFVKELPLQYRIKEGSNLLIGCEVDESDPQPHVIGVEIVEKKRKRSEGRDSRASDQSTPYTTLSPEPWVKKDITLLSPVEC